MAVTDVKRSTAFYTEVLGFEVAIDAPPPPGDENHEALADSLQDGVILMHQGMFFGLRPVDDKRANAADRFDPLRVGLDHISFAVPTRADLEAAMRRSTSAASITPIRQSSRRSVSRSWRSSTRGRTP
jgi:catechol 2,3-dioxygenase-like lactoylglutathione lyase family enzyme